MELIADPESDDPETRFNDERLTGRAALLREPWHTTSIAMRQTAASVRREAALFTGSTQTARSRGSMAALVAQTVRAGARHRTLYFTDTYNKQMYAYDYDIETGAASNRRVFASARDMAGTFDGATVDVKSFPPGPRSYSAAHLLYAPDGTLTGSCLPFPIRNLTSVMLAVQF